MHERNLLEARAWAPVLHDSVRAEAVDVARNVAGALVSDAARQVEARGPASGIHCSLARGPLPTALLLTYLERAGVDVEGLGSRLDLLEHAAACLQDSPCGIGLVGGMAGFCWAFNHMRVDVDMTDVDASLLKFLQQPRLEGSLDLVNGIVGIGVVCVERHDDVARACTGEVVRHLRQRAEERDDGTTWHVSAAKLPPWVAREFPEGYYDLGVAHGVAGIAGFLAKASVAGHSEAVGLLEGAIEWLLSQRTTDEFQFPYVVAPDRPPGTGRGVWCNGDLGISCCVMRASEALQRPEWASVAIATARHALEALQRRDSLRDPSFCHGAAGIAHMAARFFQRTGDPIFRDAAGAWAERTLRARDLNAGFGGFRFHEIGRPNGPESEPVVDRIASPCFLAGAAGVALTLLALATPVEPNWDRILLCS